MSRWKSQAMTVLYVVVAIAIITAFINGVTHLPEVRRDKVSRDFFPEDDGGPLRPTVVLDAAAGP